MKRQAESNYALANGAQLGSRSLPHRVFPALHLFLGLGAADLRLEAAFCLPQLAQRGGGQGTTGGTGGTNAGNGASASNPNSRTGLDAIANTGSGGGANSVASVSSGNGASGVVIISY